MESLIGTEELKKELASSDPPVLLDVRTEQEFNATHMPAAMSNCVYEVAFGERLAQQVPDKNQPVIVYGAHSESYEARTAVEKLIRAGYTQVREYRAGIAEWEAAGQSVVGETPLPPRRSILDGVHPIDLTQSSIEWTGRNLLNKHRGRIGLKSGWLEFKGGRLQRGEFAIDLSKIVCFDLEGTEWHQVLIKHLQSDDFFDVAKFPEARYLITAAKEIDGAAPGLPNLEISGELTLKGFTASLGFGAASGFTPDGKAASQAVFSFDRTNWNVLYGSGRLFQNIGMHLVNDLIDLEIKIVTE